MQPVTLTPQRPRALEFGIYRDGDNNLDESQGAVLAQALDVSAKDSTIQFTVEDTTSALRQAQGDLRWRFTQLITVRVG